MTADRDDMHTLRLLGYFEGFSCPEGLQWFGRALFGLLLIVVAAWSLSPGGARPLTDAETASLAATVDAFQSAMSSSDFDTIVDMMPPRALEHLATTAGTDVATLRGAMGRQMADILSQSTIDSFGMDLANGEHKEVVDGTPYVLIPTETVITIGESTTAVRSYTLALLDQGRWYLARVRDASQLEILRRSYPEFVGVEFPRGSMQAVTK